MLSVGFPNLCKILIFNRIIDTTLKVFYQYLKNDVRTRVVLRANNKDLVSPKADYYQIKAKTRKADTSSPF